GSERTHRRAGDGGFLLNGNDGESEEEKIHRAEQPADLRGEKRSPRVALDANDRHARAVYRRDRRNISRPRSTGTPPDLRFTSRSAMAARARNSSSSLWPRAASHLLCRGKGCGFWRTMPLAFR